MVLSTVQERLELLRVLRIISGIPIADARNLAKKWILGSSSTKAGQSPTEPLSSSPVRTIVRCCWNPDALDGTAGPHPEIPSLHSTELNLSISRVALQVLFNLANGAKLRIRDHILDCLVSFARRSDEKEASDSTGSGKSAGGCVSSSIVTSCKPHT